jgi:hypothetical protein
VLVLAAMIGSGCSLIEPSEVAIAAPAMACDSVQIDPPPVLQCESALQAAVEQVSRVGVVATASFHHGPPCAPNMRCGRVGGEVGYVVVQLTDGRCGYVRVGVGPEAISPPRISVSALEAWPPDEWINLGVPAGLGCQ